MTIYIWFIIKRNWQLISVTKLNNICSHLMKRSTAESSPEYNKFLCEKVLKEANLGTINSVRLNTQEGVSFHLIIAKVYLY